MGWITKHLPTDYEVNGIWSDTYDLYTKYKDVDLKEYEQEINAACHTIEDNYGGCNTAAKLVEAVLRLLLDRSVDRERRERDPFYTGE